MSIAFMLGCWAICLAAGYVLAPGSALGPTMLVAWHFGTMVSIELTGEMPDGNRRT